GNEIVVEEGNDLEPAQGEAERVIALRAQPRLAEKRRDGKQVLAQRLQMRLVRSRKDHFVRQPGLLFEMRQQMRDEPAAPEGRHDHNQPARIRLPGFAARQKTLLSLPHRLTLRRWGGRSSMRRRLPGGIERGSRRGIRPATTRMEEEPVPPMDSLSFGMERSLI